MNNGAYIAAEKTRAKAVTTGARLKLDARKTAINSGNEKVWINLQKKRAENPTAKDKEPTYYVQTRILYGMRIPQKKMPRTQTLRLCKAKPKMPLPDY